MKIRHRVIAVALSLWVLAACSTDVSFHVDDRLQIIAPQEREKVRLPVKLDWTVEDFTVVEPGSSSSTRSAGYFAIFVDQSPPPPGKELHHLFRDDQGCLKSAGCPDAEYLNLRHIYTTTETQLSLDVLPDFSDQPGKEFHEVTVVLLDPSGRRIGESAFFVRFELDRGR